MNTVFFKNQNCVSDRKNNSFFNRQNDDYITQIFNKPICVFCDLKNVFLRLEAQFCLKICVICRCLLSVSLYLMKSTKE